MIGRPQSISRAELARLRDQGLTVRDLAARFRVTERSVKRALAEARNVPGRPPEPDTTTRPADAAADATTTEEAAATAPAPRAVRVLLSGLTTGGRVYQAGEVVANPSARLLELAGGALLHGQRVAEFVGEG